MTRPWRIILFGCFALVLLHLWAAIQPSHYNWGVHFFAFYPFWISLGALIISLVLFLPKVQARLLNSLARLTERVSQFPLWLIVSALLVIWAAGLLIFAAQGHMLGDSSLILELTPRNPSDPDVTSNFRNQPLTHLLLRGLQTVMGGGGAVNPGNLYTVADLISGVLFLLLTIWFLSSLKVSTLDKVLLGLLFVFRSGNQMFFGYVENYAFLYLFVSAYLVTGWLALEGRMSILVPLACFVVMVGLHVGAGAFFPTLMPLMIPLWKKYGKRSLVLLAGVALLAAVVLDLSGYTPGVIIQRISDALRLDFLPLLTPAGGVPYGMFSLLHFVDWGNALLHVAALGVVIMLVLLIAMRRQIPWMSPLVLFLLLTSACGLAFTFWMNPALGMARDWDLMVSFFIPLRFLLVYLLIQVIDQPYVRRVLVLVQCLSFLHWASWIGVNANEDRHLERAEMLTVPVLSGTFPKIYYEHLASIMFQRGDYEKAQRWYERYVAVDSNNPRILANLADVYSREGKNEQYFGMLKEAAAKNSPNPRVYSNLGAELIKRQDTLGGIAMFGKALGHDSSFSVADANLALVYASTGSPMRSLYHAERAIRAGMKEPVLYLVAGNDCQLMHQRDRAIDFYSKYVALRPNDVEVSRLLETLRAEKSGQPPEGGGTTKKSE